MTRFPNLVEANLLCHNEGLAAQSVNYFGHGFGIELRIISCGSDTKASTELPFVVGRCIASEYITATLGDLRRMCAASTIEDGCHGAAVTFVGLCVGKSSIRHRC